MCAKKVEVRLPVCAGTWYPGSEDQLRLMLEDMVQPQRSDKPDEVHAIISPHAGYAYSGPVAAAAYARLKKPRKTVFLMGPAHYSHFSGVSILNTHAYQTPLGDVPLSPIVKELRKSELVHEIPAAHVREHSLELQLPFLQYCLGEFEIVPMLVDEVAVDYLAQLLDGYMGEDDLIVVSVDLSHFHTEEEAHVLDGAALEHIKNMDSKAILAEEIDAPWAVAALLRMADRHDWKPELTKYATSADAGGGSDRVVGYSSFIFS